jgi:hypothetical protein
MTWIVDSPAGPVLRDGDRTEMGPYVVVVSGPPMPPRPHEAVRLTEILRVARPLEDSGVELTKIRRAMQAVPRTAPPPRRPPSPISCCPNSRGLRPGWRRLCRAASACLQRPCMARSSSCWPSSWRRRPRFAARSAGAAAVAGLEAG